MAGPLDRRPASQIDPGNSGAKQVALRSYTPLQVLVLRRLAKLLHQRRECQKLVEPADWHLVLLSKATYSTYCDALALDMAAEASQLLGAGRTQVVL